ncbi:MAG TPA: acetyl-CoA carboxylase biotin carboxyl carrier protein subunit [Sporosarcina sp.]|nr:acetyl-CoA carboxylase biotin carboxyl carrier protein subunit [Sporosarcina sp.]
MAQLKATMAGSVFKVNVKVGDEVAAGDTVIVLESMKMEIPVDAEVGGEVAEVNVQEGDFVNEHDVLVTFK